MKLDIITGFEPVVPGSNPGEGTRFIHMNTQKIIFVVGLICLLSIIFIGVPGHGSLAKAATGTAAGCDSSGLVTCGCAPDGSDKCTITDFFAMLVNIYKFLVTMVATPLAVISILIGGILMMTSAGDPGRMGLGKKILYAAIIGLVLAFCSYMIINWVLQAIGFKGNWDNI